MFRRGDSFLDFYTDTAVRLLSRNTGSVPPQFIGPKLLTALHNIAGLPVMDAAGMLSPAVVRDLVRGEGTALDLFIRHSPRWPAAAHRTLCPPHFIARLRVQAQDVIRVLEKHSVAADC